MNRDSFVERDLSLGSLGKIVVTSCILCDLSIFVLTKLSLKVRVILTLNYSIATVHSNMRWVQRSGDLQSTDEGTCLREMVLKGKTVASEYSVTVKSMSDVTMCVYTNELYE